MNKHVAIAIGLFAGAMLFSTPALAHGKTQWSVTIGSPGYYTAPPVVVYPEPQYIYGAPPSVYTPPPVYVPPPVIYYVQPHPVYRTLPPARLNVPHDRQGWPAHRLGERHGHHRRSHRHQGH